MGVYEKTGVMKIFFDLDGTLVDSRQRLYHLFQCLVPVSELSFEEYWEYKRNKIGHIEILKDKFSYSQNSIDNFQNSWLEFIEQPKWLALDIPFKGVTEYLAELSQQHELYLVTARQFENRVLLQLADYSWDGFFTKVFVTAHKAEKTDMIKESIITNENDWLVGDTGKDIQTGKYLGIKTAAVLSGFMNKERLLEYEPDIIIDNVLNFKTH